MNNIRLYMNRFNSTNIKDGIIQKKANSYYYSININLIFYFIYIVLFSFFQGLLKPFLFVILITNIAGLNSYSEINLTISGYGNMQILNNDSYCTNSTIRFNSIPNEILINDVSQSYKGFYANGLSGGNYNITLRWKKKIKTTNSMFYNLQHVSYIDLSNFDSSEVTDMSCMFAECKGLTSINLNNFKTFFISYFNHKYCRIK